MKERPILFSGPMVRAILAGRKTQTRRVVKPQPPRYEDHKGSIFGLSQRVADSVKMYSENDHARLPKHPTDWDLIGSVGVARDAGYPERYRCPYGATGDRLWVRETHAPFGRDGLVGVAYRATCDRDGSFDYVTRGEAIERLTVRRWTPAIHMPRDLSRIVLAVTGVHAQRLTDISEDDAIAEGLDTVSKDGTLWKHGIADRDGLPGTDDDGQPWAEWEADPRRAFAKLWDKINGARAPWASNPWVWVVEFRRVAA